MNKFEKTSLNVGSSNKKIQVLFLPKNKKLIYQHYDPLTQTFRDVFFIDSLHTIWHMKKLTTDSLYPVGYLVDMLSRTEKGYLEKKDSFSSKPFPHLQIDLHYREKSKEILERQPLSTLWKLSFLQEGTAMRQTAIAQSLLYFRCLISCLPFFVVIGMIPFCVRATRTVPIFLLLATSISITIILFTFLNSSIILGEKQIVSPFFALFTIPLLYLFVWGIRFFAICIGFRWAKINA